MYPQSVSQQFSRSLVSLVNFSFSWDIEEPGIAVDLRIRAERSAPSLDVHRSCARTVSRAIRDVAGHTSDTRSSHSRLRLLDTRMATPLATSLKHSRTSISTYIWALLLSNAFAQKKSARVFCWKVSRQWNSPGTINSMCRRNNVLVQLQGGQQLAHNMDRARQATTTKCHHQIISTKNIPMYDKRDVSCLP